MLRFALVIGLGALLTSVTTAEDKSRRLGADEAKTLEGTWRLVDGEMGGRKFPVDPNKPITLQISGLNYVVTTGEGKDEGTVQLFPDKTPKAMDIMGKKGPNAGKTFPAIYELKDGRLKVCYDLSGKERPKDFKTEQGTSIFLAVYERVKP